MKKLIALTLVLASIFSFCACGHEHTWAEATCTEPKTCTECGAKEGEPLGHDWKDATCTEPEICSRCAETQGEPLSHQWSDATFKSPKTCSLCGETEGSAKENAFEKFGFSVKERPANFSAKGVVADKEKKPKKTKTVSTKYVFKTYTIKPSSNRENYNTIKIVVHAGFTLPKGYSTCMLPIGDLCDLYTGHKFAFRDTDGSETVELFDSVTVDGTKYTLYYSFKTKWDKFKKSGKNYKGGYTGTFLIDVPVDYDGLVLRYEDETKWTTQSGINSGSLGKSKGEGYNFRIGIT